MNNTKNFGNIVRELPPTLDNPRNSEGAFVALASGDILFVYSRFKGKDNADHATADICLLRSADDGVSFQDIATISTCEKENAVNIMSLSLLTMQNGDVGLFYLVRTTYSLMRMYLRRSSDGGNTWGERTLCTPQEGFFVVNNDRVTRLASGRIIIPAAIHRKGWCEDKDESGDGYFDSRSDSMFFYSDDDGVTWKTSENKCCMTYTAYCTSGLQEPGIIELKDGLLWGWARTDLGRQYEMFSLNNGEAWTTPQPSRFTSPNSPLSMKRGIDNNIYAIWNPVPLYNGRSANVGSAWTGGRTPMVMAVSKDNGKTFSEPLAFETDESSGYCYCAMYFTKNALLLGYCAGSQEDGSCLVRTRIRRISLKELGDELSKSN